jgi:hypothetical protein
MKTRFAIVWSFTLGVVPLLAFAPPDKEKN